MIYKTTPATAVRAETTALTEDTAALVNAPFAQVMQKPAAVAVALVR